MEFRRQYSNRPKVKGEPGGGKCLVETAGYIPAERRIKDIMSAGQRLQKARAEQFDIAPGKPFRGVVPDPTRAPGLDLVDMQDLRARGAKAVREYLKFKAEKARQKKAEEAGQTAVEPPKAPEVPKPV